MQNADFVLTEPRIFNIYMQFGCQTGILYLVEPEELQKPEKQLKVRSIIENHFLLQFTSKSKSGPKNVYNEETSILSDSSMGSFARPDLARLRHFPKNVFLENEYLMETLIFNTKKQIPPPFFVLTSYEIFFLKYAFGCVRVYSDDKSKEYSLQELWQMFSEKEGAERFLCHYAAYHYFRSEGWVPKSGLKFGCDFTLYYRGPDVDHSKYSVQVIPVNQQLQTSNFEKLQAPNSEINSFLELQESSRLASSVQKKLVLCYVFYNQTTDSDAQMQDEHKFPFETLLRSVSIKTTLVSRFRPEGNR